MDSFEKLAFPFYLVDTIDISSIVWITTLQKASSAVIRQLEVNHCNRRNAFEQRPKAHQDGASQQQEHQPVTSRIRHASHFTTRVSADTLPSRLSKSSALERDHPTPTHDSF
jgi:hypothetical protein